MKKRVIKPINFKREQLDNFVEKYKIGKSPRTWPTYEKSANTLWKYTNGSINQNNWNNLYDDALQSYKQSSQTKLFGFIKNFLKWLEVDHEIEPNWYIEKLKPVKDRVIKEPPAVKVEDIQNVLKMIEGVNLPDKSKYDKYKTMILFQAYTGQRPEFITHLTVKQVKDAIETDYHTINVEPWQDKQGKKVNRPHLCAIHPILLPLLKNIIEGREDLDKPVFGHKMYESINKLFQNHPVPNITTPKISFNLGHCRKFFEQESGRVGFKNARNGEYCNFMMFHDTNTMSAKHYTRILPDELYNAYMESWSKVDLTIKGNKEQIPQKNEISSEEKEYNERKYREYLQEFHPEKYEELVLEELIKSHYETLDEEQARQEEEWSKEYDRKNKENRTIF